MYQHLYSLLQQWSNFPLGLGKGRLNILSPQTWGAPASLIQTVTCLHTSVVQRGLAEQDEFIWVYFFFIVVFFVTGKQMSSALRPFCCNCQAFPPPLSKVPLNNLDYHANSVNTRLLFFLCCCQQAIYIPADDSGICVQRRKKANVQTPRCEKTPAAGKVMHWKCSLSSAHHQGKPELLVFHTTAPAVFWLQLHWNTSPIHRLEWKNTTYWNLFQLIWNQRTSCRNEVFCLKLRNNCLFDLYTSS